MRLFGTDGIRGAVNGEKINPEIAAKLGKALVKFCRARNLPASIIIARDTRESGPELEDSVAKGITSAGGDAILAGVIPTPALAYLTREREAGMGLVISASHNPFGDNGFKPFTNAGNKLEESEEAELERYILGEDSQEKKGENFIAGKKIVLADAKERYANFILGKLPAECEGSDLKVVLDCANGAVFEVAPQIFSRIGKTSGVICANPDGKNINDNCGSQYVESLRAEIFAKNADLGLAFDGDGDRVIAVDEKGGVLTGDQMIYVIAKMLKAKEELKNNLVVTTVMSNIGFVGDLKKMGIGHIATAVGDQPVFRQMRKHGAILGGEESGHIIYTDYNPAGDGIVGGIMLMTAMNYFKKPLSELAAQVTLFPKLLVNIPVKSKPKLDSIPEIADSIEEVEKKLGDEGRVLVRYSGTENLCRVMVEGRDRGEIEEYANGIAKIIRDHLG